MSLLCSNQMTDMESLLSHDERAAISCDSTSKSTSVDVKQDNRNPVQTSNLFAETSKIKSFVTSCHGSLDFICLQAKRLHLVKTLSGRAKKSGDRVGFGLKKVLRKTLQTPLTLFKFGISSNGSFKPSKFMFM